jgi:hypothetical protein
LIGAVLSLAHASGCVTSGVYDMVLMDIPGIASAKVILCDLSVQYMMSERTVDVSRSVTLESTVVAGSGYHGRCEQTPPDERHLGNQLDSADSAVSFGNGVVRKIFDSNEVGSFLVLIIRFPNR